MKKGTIALFVSFIVASTPSMAGTSDNASKLLEGAAKKSTVPQVKHDCNGKDCYAPALGDRDFKYIHKGHLRHMGTDVWENYDSKSKNFNKQVYSVAEGIVISKALNYNDLGNGLVILHPRAGKDGKDIYSLYLHMKKDEYFKNIYLGKYIPPQTRIGTISNTQTIVSHLHLELRKFPEWFYTGVKDPNIYTDIGLVSDTTVDKLWVDPMTYEVPSDLKVDKKGVFWVTKHLKKYVNRNSLYPTTSTMCKDVFDDAMAYYNSYGVTTAINNNNADFNVKYNPKENVCLFKKSGYTSPESVILYYPGDKKVMGLSKNKNYNANWRPGYNWDWPRGVYFSPEEAVKFLK